MHAGTMTNVTSVKVSARLGATLTVAGCDALPYIVLAHLFALYARLCFCRKHPRL